MSEITFVMNVYKDFERATACLENLVQVYPKNRIVVISDGDDDPRWVSLEKRFGAEVHYSQRFFSPITNGGALIHFRLDRYFKGERTGFLAKIDTDTLVIGKIEPLVDPRCVIAFGTLVPYENYLQGGCYVLSTAAAEKMYLSGYLISDELRDYRRSWMRPCFEYAIQQNVILEDRIFAYACNKLDIPMVFHPKIYSTSQLVNIPSNLNRTVLHPVKQMCKVNT